MRPVGRTCAREWSHVHQFPRCPELTKFDPNGQFNPKRGHKKPQKLSRSTQTLADDRRRPSTCAEALRALPFASNCPNQSSETPVGPKVSQTPNCKGWTRSKPCKYSEEKLQLVSKATKPTCDALEHKGGDNRPQTPIPCLCETQLADQTFNKFRKMRKQQTPRKLQFDRVAFSKLLVVVGKSTDAMDSCRARTKREFKCTGIKESKVFLGFVRRCHLSH